MRCWIRGLCSLRDLRRHGYPRLGDEGQQIGEGVRLRERELAVQQDRLQRLRGCRLRIDADPRRGLGVIGE